MKAHGSTYDQVKCTGFHSINEIEPQIWDRIVAGRGFQSHHWYQFGERAMADCPPTYLVAWDRDVPIASTASLKSTTSPCICRKSHGASYPVFKHRPLLVCRSPLADTSALLLPGEPLRDQALTTLAQAAREQFKQQRASFLLFDYLLTEQLRYPAWPEGFEPITVSEPGTYMPMEWESFEAYLESGNKHDRQHYKRSLREAENTGLVSPNTRPSQM
jgi:hypothetical protein